MSPRQVLGRASRAAQAEGWAEVVDCAASMEQLMAGCRKKSNGSACALRVLRSGLKVRVRVRVRVKVP